MLCRLLLLLALLIPASSPALAMSPEDMVRVDLLSGWREDGQRHFAGLRVRLAPGWKTYWRAPGEAGIPPKISFAGSTNLSAAQLHWPVPDVFDAFGLRTIGYGEEVTLPLELRAAKPGAPIGLDMRVELGICKEICVPVSMRLSASLPASGERDGTILAALRDRPRDARSAGMRDVVCRIRPAERGVTVTAALEMAPLGADETAVIELPHAEAWVSAATSKRFGSSLIASADVIPHAGRGLALDRSAIVITVLAEGRAVEARGCRAE